MARMTVAEYLSEFPNLSPAQAAIMVEYHAAVDALWDVRALPITHPTHKAALRRAQHAKAQWVALRSPTVQP